MGEDALRVLQKLSGAALLCSFSVLQDDNLVGGLDGAHPVRNDKHSLAGQQPGQGSLHLCFVFHVQGGRGLVQQDDGGVFQQGPGNRDPLTLAAGERAAVFADDGVIALRQLPGKFVAVGQPGRAARTSSSVASFLPTRMFSRMLLLNSVTSGR